MALEHFTDILRRLAFVRDPVEYVPVEIIPAHKIVSQEVLELAIKQLREKCTIVGAQGKKVDLRLTIHNLNLHGQRELMSHQVIKWVKLDHIAGSSRFVTYPHRVTFTFLGKSRILKDL